jgi:multiple sugar transport system substrate-binding protein
MKLLGAALLAAVSLGGLKPALAAELELAMWQYEEPGAGGWWKQVLEAFKAEHPDINVTVTNIPFADYLDQMTVRFASSRPPGLVTLLPVNMPLFATQGWLEPLDEQIKGTPVGTDQWSPLQSEQVWEDKTMGVLISAIPDMLYYNKKMLSDAGVAVPTSYDEFVAAVAKVHNPDAGFYGFSAVSTEHPQIGFDLIEHAEWQGVHPILDGKYNFTAPDVVAAIDKWRNLVKTYAPLGLNSTKNRRLFADGKAAFMLNGSQIWAVVETGPDEVKSNVEAVRAPFASNMGGGVLGLHIPTGLPDDVKQAAWELIDFVIQPEWQEKLAVANFSAAGLNVTLPEDVLNSKSIYRNLQTAIEGVVPRSPLLQAIRENSAEFNEICMRTSMKLLSTDLPTADVLAEAQAQLEQAVPLS